MILTLKNKTILIMIHNVVEIQALNTNVIITLTRGIKEIQFQNPEQAKTFVRCLSVLMQMGTGVVELDVLKEQVEKGNAETYTQQTVIRRTNRAVSIPDRVGLGEDIDGRDTTRASAGGRPGQATGLGDLEGEEVGGVRVVECDDLSKPEDIKDSILHSDLSFGFPG